MPAKTSPDAHHGLALRFDVTIDGYDLGGWSKCDGLDVTFDICSYQEGNNPNFLWYFPGNTKYSHIKLSRACTREGTSQVMGWLKEMTKKPKFGGGKIILHDAWTEEVASWQLTRVLPVKWTGPSLDAGGAAVAIESLELAHEGFLV